MSKRGRDDALPGQESLAGHEALKSPDPERATMWEAIEKLKADLDLYRAEWQQAIKHLEEIAKKLTPEEKLSKEEYLEARRHFQETYRDR